jgi:PEGA domain-containing protein
MRQTRGVVLACVAFLALTGAGATAAGAQGTKPSRDSLAHLSLVSKPSGKITIDDSIVGETPRALSVPAGTHKIRISREGYLPYETTIVIERGETLRIVDIVLNEKPKPRS